MFKIISETIGIVARSKDPKAGPQQREESPVLRPAPRLKTWPRLG